MTEAQAIEAMEEQFVAQWPTESDSVPFAMENETFPSADTFAVLSFTHTTGQQLTFGPPGSRRWERRGYAFVKLWVPIDGGRATASGLADAARRVLEGQTLGGAPGVDPVVLAAGETIEVGTDDRWYMTSVRFAFVYRETR